MASREYLGLNPEGVTAFADQLRFAASQADEIAEEIRAAMVLSGLDGPATEMKAVSDRIDRVASAVRARSNQASSFRLPVLSRMPNVRATGPSISASPGGFVVPVDTKHPIPPKWPTDTKHPNPVNWPKDTKHPTPTKFPTDTKHPTPVRRPTDTKHPWPTAGGAKRAATGDSGKPEDEGTSSVDSDAVDDVTESVPALDPVVNETFQFPGAGRSGAGVKDFVGPENSVVKGASEGRIFVTDGEGRVILDITEDRAKPVVPGQGFVAGEGRKIPPTPQQLEWIKQLWG